MKLARWRADLVLALVALAGIAFLYGQTYAFPPSPVRGQPGSALFPRAILIMLAVVTVLIGLGAIRDALARRRMTAAGREAGEIEFDWRPFLGTVAAVVTFCVLLDLIGFEPTALLLMGTLLYRAYGSWTKAVVGAVVSTLVLYVVFVLGLGVTMPLAVLPTFINL